MPTQTTWLKAISRICERKAKGRTGRRIDVRQIKFPSVAGYRRLDWWIFGCVVVWKLVNNKPLAIESIAPNSFAGQAAAQIREHVAAAIEPIKTQF